MSRRAVHQRLLLGLGVAISVALLIVVLRRADIPAVVQHLGRSNVWLLLLGACGVNVAVVPQAVRWRTMTAAVASRVVRTRSFLAMIVVAQAINSVIPARAGDAVRVIWLRREMGLPVAQGTASMLADRVLDLVFLAFVLGVGASFVAAPPWLVMISAGAFVASVIFVSSILAYRWVAGTGRGAPAHTTDGHGAPRAVRAWIRSFFASLTNVLSASRLIRGMALTALSWSMWAVGALAIAMAVDVEVSFLQVLFIAALLNVGLAIPSSPGFVGTYQWLVMEGVALFGVGASAGLAFAVVLQAAWLIPQTLIGFALLPRLGFRLRGGRPIEPAADAAG